MTHKQKLLCTENVSCMNKSLPHTTSTYGTGLTWWYQWLTKKEDYEKEKDGEKENITVTKTVK